MIIIDQRANDILEDTVRRVRSIKGGPGIRVVNSSMGITISLDRGAIPSPNSAPMLFSPQSFAVYLTQNGGANGDDGTTTTAAFPTYTYDVFTDAAKTVQIGTAVTVEWHRPMKVAVTAGAHGSAQWDGSTLRLLNTDEYFDRDAC